MSNESPAPSTSDLERVRGELRRLGYLSHGLERFLLQDALRPQRPLRTLLQLALKVGLANGIFGALVVAFALAAANGNLSLSPFDLLPLFLHLFPAIALAAALAFLLLGGAMVLVLRWAPIRRVETLTFAAAAAAGAAALVGLVWRAREIALAAGDAGSWQLAVLAIATPLAIYGLVKTVHHGLLSLAIRLTDEAPPGRLFSRRWLGAAVLAGASLLTLPAVLAVRQQEPRAPGAFPSAPGERVLLLGIDGVLPEELDYLLARRELPTFSRLASEGALLRYLRPDVPPAAFWTTIATGRPTPEHGVAAIDGFLPLGVRTPLSRSGPLRSFWNDIERPLGLAEHRPVLANRRSAFAFWELAARGGAPIAAINLWSTFPARSLPGLTLAHGGYQLLGDGTKGAVAPEADAAELATLRDEVRNEVTTPREFGLSPHDAELLADRALRPDELYRRAFECALAKSPRAAALYLPALDLAADGWKAGDVAFADLLRSEIGKAEVLLERAASGFGTIVVVVDPGRRRVGAEGRAILWRVGGCRRSPTGPERVAPESLAAGLLRALGLPQSAELPLPPAACSWPAPPSRIATFGTSSSPSLGDVSAPAEGEYLENLRSLGYL